MPDPHFPVRRVDLSFLDEAQVRFDTPVELDCSPRDLFAIFADGDSWPVWAPGFERIHWTSPRPFRAGTTRTAHLKGGIGFHEEFLVWDDGERMAFTFVGSTKDISGGLDAFIEDYRVTDLGGGRCRLVWTLAYAPAGFMRHFQWAVRPFVGVFLRLILRGLRRYVAKGDHARAEPLPA